MLIPFKKKQSIDFGDNPKTLNHITARAFVALGAFDIELTAMDLPLHYFDMNPLAIFFLKNLTNHRDIHNDIRTFGSHFQVDFHDQEM